MRMVQYYETGLFGQAAPRIMPQAGPIENEKPETDRMRQGSKAIFGWLMLVATAFAALAPAICRAAMAPEFPAATEPSCCSEVPSNPGSSTPASSTERNACPLHRLSGVKVIPNADARMVVTAHVRRVVASACFYVSCDLASAAFGPSQGPFPRGAGPPGLSFNRPLYLSLSNLRI